jgi:hypothetical protein
MSINENWIMTAAAMILTGLTDWIIELTLCPMSWGILLYLITTNPKTMKAPLEGVRTKGG